MIKSTMFTPLLNCGIDIDIKSFTFMRLALFATIEVTGSKKISVSSSADRILNLLGQPSTSIECVGSEINR